MLVLIVLASLATVALLGVALYNRLVRMRNTVRSAWADIDVHLRKRHNLVDNLVDTVRGYASHEKETLSTVTEARTSAIRATGAQAKGAAENVFQETLKSLFALSESYPQLKADQGFLRLQGQLHEIENGIEHARRYYNAVVRDYNTLTEAFPSNLIASQFSFRPEAFFQIEEPASRLPVKVRFSPSP